MTELPNLPIHQQPEILKNYMPWSKESKSHVQNSHLSKKNRIDGHSSCVLKKCAFLYFGLTIGILNIINIPNTQKNTICLSLAETAKANGIEFYQYLVKLLIELSTLPIYQQSELQLKALQKYAQL